MKLEFSRQIFEESSNIKFHLNPSGGSRVVPCGQTDLTKLSRFSQLVRKRLKTNSAPYEHYVMQTVYRTDVNEH